MTDTRTLLERHAPRLVYDSQEAYFADSAGVWTDSPTNVLKRADSTTLAKPPVLSLSFLAAHTYANGKAVLAGDTIGESTRNYAADARAMHAKPGYGNVIHGRLAKDKGGHTWLQYWFFYYYNDFQLLGPLLSGGDHEGDWEMIQLRLNAAEQPELAVYAQHSHAESKAWKDVKKSGNVPYVYVARGSHASYFSSGSHWTGSWWDQADGKGPTVTATIQVLQDAQPAWVTWPGYWGDTKATGSPIDATSPQGPVKHAQWSDPATLVALAARRAAAPPAKPLLAEPTFTATRSDGRLKIAYHAPMTPTAIVVGLRPEGSLDPAVQHVRETGAARGEVEVPIGADAHEVMVSAVAPDGNATPTASGRVGPARMA